MISIKYIIKITRNNTDIKFMITEKFFFTKFIHFSPIQNIFHNFKHYDKYYTLT